MPAPMHIGRRESGPNGEPMRSPLLHPALSASLSKSFGLNSPFSLSAMSTSLTMLSSSPSFSSMGMSLGRSFEERPKLEAQFFRNFSCCGLDLQDLHGLLEHFEECHVAFDDNELEMDLDNGSDGTISGPPSPRMSATHPSMQPSLHQQHPHQEASMELDMDMDDVSGDSSFEMPSSGSLGKKKFSAAMNPLSRAGVTTVPGSVAGGVPGAGMGLGGVGNGQPGMEDHTGLGQQQQQHQHIPQYTTQTNFIVEAPGLYGVQPSLAPNVGLPPSLLFPGAPGDSPGSDDVHHSNASSSSSEAAGTANLRNLGGSGGTINYDQALASGVSGSAMGGLPGAPGTLGAIGGILTASQQANAAAAAAAVANGGNSGLNTPSGSPTNTSSSMGPLAALHAANLSAMHPLGTGVQISPSGRPYTPPSEKPFKCSVIGCDKSYKQQNGLKYHRLHGHCNQNATGDEDGSEGKPYVCHVLSCGKRYKNMNGLRYHYQHSGAHGAMGLQMLAQAVHPPPQFPPGHKRASAANSPAQSRDSSPAGLGRSSTGVPLGGAGMGSGIAAPVLSGDGAQLI